MSAQEWDSLASAVGGGYFHSHAEATYVASASRTQPLFLWMADAQDRPTSVATGTIWRPRKWPGSRFCGQVTLLSLPATCSRSPDLQQNVLSAMEAWLGQQGVFSIRVASYDSSNSEAVLSALNYELTPRHEFVIDLSRTEEEIWKGFKGERRTDVRKAEALHVETRRQTTPEGLDLVAEFQNESMQRRDNSVPSGDHISAARRARLASGAIEIFVSYHEDLPINAALFGFVNGQAYYHVSGSSDEGYRCKGPVHLLWTAIRLFHQRGARSLNLGAALAGQDGLFKFKRDFGATVVPAPMGRKQISLVGSALDKARGFVSRRPRLAKVNEA
jgi:hypothetical protein